MVAVPHTRLLLVALFCADLSTSSWLNIGGSLLAALLNIVTVGS